jgi:hypothetical protein
MEPDLRSSKFQAKRGEVFRRGAGSLRWRTQARLREPARGARRFCRWRNQASRLPFLTTLLTRAYPRISPFGSRSGGIYPERPCAPVFVSFRVVCGLKKPIAPTAIPDGGRN